MNKQKQRLYQVNKVAKIKTADLPIFHHVGEPKEHYVYVREYDKKKQAYKVNVCTHLEIYDKKTHTYVSDEKRLRQVKFGNTYPVPVKTANFPVWTGVKKDIYEVPKGKMYNWNCVKVKKPLKDETDKYFR